MQQGLLQDVHVMAYNQGPLLVTWFKFNLSMDK